MQDYLTVYSAVAVLVGVVASARLTRLIAHDAFPPSEWLRTAWVKVVRGSEKWSMLIECPWCLAPYIVAANGAWALLSDLHWSWWLFNGWLAAAYVASWIVFHDEDGGN